MHHLHHISTTFLYVYVYHVRLLALGCLRGAIGCPLSPRNNCSACMCVRVVTGGWLERLRTGETRLNNQKDAQQFFRELSKKEDAKVLVLEFDDKLLPVLQDAMRMLR